MEPAPLRIVRLETENVKRLVAVAIKPDGDVIVVGGKNGAGKSSLLDSIAYAIGGQSLICDQPLRKGADKGHVEVDLGDLVVRRTFTASGGGTLTVSNKDGAVYRSPQAMLDKLVGRLSFDPLDFSRMEPKKQVETLRSLVGLDFSEIDAERSRLYEERTSVNRTTKALEAKLATMPQHEAPDEEVSVAALMEALEAAQASEAAALDAEITYAEWTRDIETHERLVADAVARVADLERQLAVARASVIDEENLLVAQRDGAEKSKALAISIRAAVISATPIREQIASADATNALVRANAARAEQAAEVAGSKAEADRLTAAIEALDTQKATTLAETKFPVDGLSFDASGVVLNGVPFAQGSSAEQLRVSVAMGLAMNPRLGVLLIRDASLLDDDSMAIVAEMAANSNAQVWLERVGDGDECSVVIEDGSVRGAVEVESAVA